MLQSRIFVSAAAMAALVASSASADYGFEILVETGDVFAGQTIIRIGEDPQANLNDAGQFTFRHETENEERSVFRGSIHDPGQAALLLAGGQPFDSVAVHGVNHVIRMNQTGQIALTFDTDPNSVPENDYPIVIARDSGVELSYGDSIDDETFAGTVTDGIDIDNAGTLAHFSKIPAPQPPVPGYNYEGAERLVIGGVIVKRPADANGNPLDQIAGEHFQGFHQDSRIDINDSGAYLVSYWKDDSFDDALAYINGGTETVLAHDGDMFFDGGVATGETIGGVSRAFALNNQGDVAYSVYLEGPGGSERSVIVLNGDVVASDGDVVDGLTITSVEPDTLQLTESGELAYSFAFDYAGDPWGGTAIVFGNEVVAYSGMLIDGRTVLEVFDEGFAVNNLGQLAFGVEFEDGGTALVLATIPEPATAGILAVASTALLLRWRQPQR